MAHDHDDGNGPERRAPVGDLAAASREVRRDERTGWPRKIRGELELPQGDQAADNIRGFLAQHGDELGLQADENNLRLIQDVTTPTRRIVRFEQAVDGIPVLDSTVVVQLDKGSQRVKELDLGHEPEAALQQVDRDAQITPGQAEETALQAAGEGTPRQEIPPPELVYFRSDAGLRLAYKVLIPTREPVHDWRIVVDAGTAEVLQKTDLVAFIDGQGLVFDPNPVVTANNNTFRDPNAGLACGFSPTAIATLDGQRLSRTLRDITFDGTVHKLEGPFVKLRNFGAPATAPPTEAVATNFNYSSVDDRFEAVMVYYHVDTLQRYIQSLGITTALNGQIEADAHDNSSGGGAFYSPIDKGIHFGDSGSCRPDRGEEADAILHEYGHAIQDNQVPGWGVTSPVTGRRETRAMGEGFGDILACVFFAEHGGGFQREVFEDWVFADAGGLRRVDGTKVYPADWAFQEHADGEIWSAALWNIYRAIGGDSMIPATRQAARDALLKTLILSHHSVASDATMPDGAEALMDTDAELDEFRGAHLIEMLDSFHDRGILRSEPGVDLFIREAPGDPGADAFVGPVFWDSPDLWIRNGDDGLTSHQSPEFGQDNWFHARVTNRGTQTARAFVVTFNVKPWAGVQFTYPGDFIPFVSAAVGYNLAPGASQVVKAKWPAALVPPVGTHACWLASVYTPVDLTPAGRHVWEHNNLAQKNLAIVDLIPGDSTVIPFQIGNRFQFQRELVRIEVRRPERWNRMPVSLVHPSSRLLGNLFRSVEETRPVGREVFAADAGAPQTRAQDATFSRRDVELSGGPTEGFRLAFRPGSLAGFPVLLQPRTPVQLGLKVSLPRNARPGETMDIHVVERNRDQQVIGGITVRVRAVAR